MPYLVPSMYRLKVEGKGSIAVQPDTATVILGVSTEDKQLRLAQEENAKKVTGVINSLKAMGIPSEDIATHSFTIDPQYDITEGRQVFRDYRVLHTLKITVKDLNKLGEIIDRAVESGANVVNSISFTVSEPSRYYNQALKAAIDDAVNKAITIGDKLKVVLYQTPIQITEESYQTGAPFMYAISAAPRAATPIQTGQIDISARIEAIFTYAQY